MDVVVIGVVVLEVVVGMVVLVVGLLVVGGRRMVEVVETAPVVLVVAEPSPRVSVRRVEIRPPLTS